MADLDLLSPLELLTGFAREAAQMATLLPDTHWQLPDLSDIPENPPLSEAEQGHIALLMQIPIGLIQHIRRSRCFHMPEHPLCIMYRDWYISQPVPADSQPHGIVIENFETWTGHYGVRACTELLLALLMNGELLIHWTFTHDVVLP